MADDHHSLWERIIAAINVHKFDVIDDLFAEDYVEEYPQSGEVVRGRANLRAILENYPRPSGDLRADPATVRSQADDAFKPVGPTFTIVRVRGGAETGVLTMKMRYPDGSFWWVVRTYALKDGKVAQATTFFAPEFPAPAWRAKFVERAGG